MATREQVNSFREGLSALVMLARADLAGVWSGIDTSDPIAVRNLLERAMPDLVATYGSTAALLAADYYDELAGGFGVDVPAVLDESIRAAQVQASTRWALGPLFQAEPDAAATSVLLDQVVDRLVKQSARNTINSSAKRDGVRYARVPTGAEPCEFCYLLAGRGPVYGSKESAGGEGNSYHADCSCVPTPMRDERDYPDGYDPNAMYDVYLEARAQADSGSVKDILARMLRVDADSI